MVAHKEFELRKQAVLQALGSEEVDKSRKGGVDVQIADLIREINNHRDFYTTSSCSGRISLFLDQPCSTLHSLEVYDGDGDEERVDSTKGKEKKQKGGDWIYVSHEPAVVDEVLQAVREKFSPGQKGLLVFRFEPFILALECSSLNASQQLVTCALASGFRESGITSAGKRCIVAIRCSIRVEVPIADEGELLVTDQYLKYLVKLANKKMVLNQQRIDRFQSAFAATLGSASFGGLSRELVEFSTDGRKAVKKKRRKISGEVANKLLGSLEKRQLGVLSRISFLVRTSCVILSPNLTVEERVVTPATETSKGVLKESTSLNPVDKALPVQVPSQFSGLRAASFVIPGEPVEKLYRWGHSTCALGGKEEPGCNSLIIHGGYGGPDRHARMNDLVILNVEEGSLRTVQTAGTPAPIMAHTASRVRDLMVVIGGRRDPSCVLNTVSVLDLKTFEWKFPDITGVEFSPRHRHAAAVVDCRIYVYGGLSGTQALSDLYTLDTASWSWSLIICGGELPSARHSHSLAAVGDKLVLFGGREGNKVYGDLHILDLASLQWSQVKAGGRPPSPRFSHTVTIVGDHHVAVNGGCPITKDKDLVLLDTTSLIWIRLQVDWGSESLLVRHSSSLVGDSLITVGGGAACFAFGTHFSPPSKLKLEPFLENESRLNFKRLNFKQHREISQPLYMENSRSEGNLLSWILKVDSCLAKQAKDSLKLLGWLDPARKSKVLEHRRYISFPILESAAAFISDQSDSLAEQVRFSSEGSRDEFTIKYLALQNLLTCRGEVLRAEMPVRGKQYSSPFARMEEAVGVVLKQNGLSFSLLQELPKKWERLGDMVVFPARSLTTSVWSSVGEELWRIIAASLNANRLARQAPIAAKGTRDSQLQLLYGKDGWVEHKENGILYCFDATKCMFSSGNVSEKLRVANMQCRGATVVDLFAGIGYYVLPFLIKAGATHVYACEWNPHAITALRHNLRVNGVEEVCTVLEGDSRSTAPVALADIVSLGLLPSSEGSWPTAVSAFRPEGGLLLVHENVKDSDEEVWTKYLLTSVKSLATSLGRVWDVSIVHFERVKWYAPHIRHVVAEVRCKQSIV